MHMIVVSRVGESITGTVNMKNFGIKYTKEKYDQMIELKAQADDAVSMAELKDIVAKFELLTKEDYKSTVQTACPDLYVNEGKGTFHLKLANGKVSKRVIPQPLVERILKSIELGIDTTPLIKFCIRALRPVKGKIMTQEKFERIAKYVNYMMLDQKLRDELIATEGVTAEVATERAMVYQTPITMEGLLCTYKVSSELLEKYTLDDNGNKKAVPRYGKKIDEDTGEVTSTIPDHVEDRVFYPAVQGLTGGDPFFCEHIADQTGKLGHLIRVGHIHRLEDWSKVNQNDDQSCVKGLHVGNLDYIRNYERGEGKVTHNVFVDPMHIGAITDDGSGALRVLQYFVHSSRAGENRGIYHSSHYAALTDAQWDEIKAEIYADAVKQCELLDEDQEEIAGLSKGGSVVDDTLETEG